MPATALYVYVSRTEGLVFSAKSAPDGTCAFLGALLMEVDGYFYFWPESSGGFWPEWTLRGIADKLADLNREWDERVARDLSPDDLIPPGDGI